MKKGLILANIVALLFFASCSEGEEQERFTLNGQIQNPGELQYVFMYNPDEEVDTLELDQNNAFHYEGNAPEGALYTIALGQRPYMLVLENGQEIQFNVDAKAPERYSVTGSEVSSKLVELDAMRQSFQEQQANLQKEFQRRMSSGEELTVVQNELLSQNAETIRELSEPVLEFSKENKENLAGFYGMITLYSADPTGNEEAVIKYVEEVQDQFPNNKDVQAFAAHVEKIKPLSIGQMAPDFTSLTPEGEEGKLSDFRGKYVLLDFWAAWCAPCRDENPNIVAQYHAFKDDGFTVLGVSLDRDRDAWLQAIEDDKLEWNQLSDLQMWDSEVARLYNISAIPASFMIGPEGKIIGKNLRGPALKRFLEENL